MSRRSRPQWYWLLFAAVVLGAGHVGTQQETLSPTRQNASQVAAAIVAALHAMGRSVIRQESWLYPLAVASLETSSWQKPIDVRAMLLRMRGIGALGPADRGDLPAFQAAMTKYTGGEVHPYSDLSAIVQRLRGTIVDSAA
jgi:hypothetical protein